MSSNIFNFIVSTKGFDDFIDITSKVQDLVSNCQCKMGQVNIFTPSACTSIKIIENEPGLNFDVSKMLELIAPVNKIYQHDNLWHDGNAYSHLKTILFGSAITLPIIDSQIALGAFQQIVLIDFDNKPSQKEVIVSVAY